MAGIYIHIPFCKTRCIYCDFFSSTSMKAKMQYVNALCKEIDLQRDYLQHEPVQTIYFGGGTPSQLDFADFEKIFAGIERAGQNFKMLSEVTLEANPDDITAEYLESLKPLPFNRISMGVQSFDDKELQFLNRRHDAAGAIRAVELCQSAGYENISIDLIYGLPGQSLSTWNDNLRRAIDLNVRHISAYHLIYEEGTELYRLLKSQKIEPVDEDLSLSMFGEMIDRLKDAGFEHYEISNFAKAGYRSKHNSSYWNGTPYLGLGASAHSYNRSSRQWNVSSLQEYIDSMNQGIIPAEIEQIDFQTAYNDYIITRMRTIEGLNLDEIGKVFGEGTRNICLKQAQPYLLNGTVVEENNILTLSRKGIFISDSIISDLLIVS